MDLANAGWVTIRILPVVSLMINSILSDSDRISHRKTFEDRNHEVRYLVVHSSQSAISQL